MAVFRGFVDTLGDTVEPVSGAQKRTRTSTPLRAPAPEAGASTNSAIWARGRPRELGAAPALVNAQASGHGSADLISAIPVSRDDDGPFGHSLRRRRVPRALRRPGSVPVGRAGPDRAARPGRRLF